MAQVQPTLSVTVDDNTFVVANMSEQVQQMIELMDNWRQKEADTASDLVMIRSAIRDIQNSLLMTIRQEQAAAAQEAANAANSAPAEAAPAPSTPDQPAGA